jgi:hypothetical protein
MSCHVMTEQNRTEQNGTGRDILTFYKLMPKHTA